MLQENFYVSIMQWIQQEKSFEKLSVEVSSLK